MHKKLLMQNIQACYGLHSKSVTELKVTHRAEAQDRPRCAERSFYRVLRNEQKGTKSKIRT
jgi:hypothetical protein